MSALVFGTAGLGLPYGLARAGETLGLMPEEAVRGLVDASLASGVEVFDTAPAYGVAEERLGSALGPRGHVWTKLGRTETLGPSLVEDALSSLERSLARLSRTEVDLLQWHNWTENLADAPSFRATWDRLRADARVRKLGASTYGSVDAIAAVDSGLFDVVQVEWNLLNQRVVDAVGDRARRRGVSIAVRSVFLQGALAGEERQLPRLPALHSGLERARKCAADAGLSLRDLALRSALDHEAVSFVLMGIDREEQLAEAVALRGSPPLGDATREAVRSLSMSDDRAVDPRTWPQT